MTSMQGTYEFMSDELVDTQRTWPRSPYLHSPVDDLESFYYTAQWAVAFNKGASGGRFNGPEIQDLREMIAGRERAMATIKVTSLTPFSAEAKYGLFFARSLRVLTPWRLKFFTLCQDWSDVLHSASLRNGNDKEEYLRLNFYIFGYRGVVEYLELVHKHHELL